MNFALNILLFVFLLTYAQAADSSPDSLKQEMADVFLNSNDSVVNNGTGSCSFKCREVKSGYGTQVVGYDFANGITYCSVFEMNNMNMPLKFNANQQNLQCKIEANTYMPAPIRNNSSYVSSKITQSLSGSDITLSRFLSSLATLDPNIIDREATELTGSLTLANGITTRGSVGGLYEPYEGNLYTNTAITLNNAITPGKPLSYEIQKYPAPTTDGEKISLADSFNKSNMAYFSNLYKNMGTIYTHLQNLLFVVVGGFFLSVLGFGKLQTYLEYKGQGSGRNEPYLHKFLIPLIVVSTFYMPIPESKDSSATIVQKVIRYFTTQANNIADLASAEGAKTYMNKLYASVGGIGAGGETFLYKNLYLQKFINKSAIKEYESRCSVKYPNGYGVPYTEMNEQELKRILESQDVNQVAGTNKDISFQACIKLERQIWESNNQIKQIEKQIDSVSAYYDNNVLNDNLAEIDAYIAKRELEFGWLNSIFTPATGLMVELQNYITDEVTQDDEEIRQTTMKNQEAVKDSITRGEVEEADFLTNLSADGMGWIIGRVGYMTLPGAGGVYNFLSNKAVAGAIGIVKGASLIASNKIASWVGKIPLVGTKAKVVTTMVGSAAGAVIGAVSAPFIAIYFTAEIYESILEILPILIASVAACLVFIGYLVSLIKYFYISPFVVAFALTTKRVDKIIDFLISGITIFFKPILIVLFIYLALFLNTLISEFFMLVSTEQFGAMNISDNDFFASMKIASIQVMLKILGALASCYVMWKTILTAPDWTFKLLGVDKDSDNVISQGLSQKLEQRTFMS